MNTGEAVEVVTEEPVTYTPWFLTEDKPHYLQNRKGYKGIVISAFKPWATAKEVCCVKVPDGYLYVKSEFLRRL